MLKKFKNKNKKRRRSLVIKNCQSYNSNPSRRIQNQGSCGFFNVQSGFKILLFLVGISSLFYVFQINQLATMGQEINDKELALEKLKEDNKSLEIKVTQLKSSYHFESERERLNLVNPDQVSFVEMEGEGDGAVAMAK